MFANDLVNPQLIAVTNVVNRAKGDKGPETWKPPIGTTLSSRRRVIRWLIDPAVSFYCTYAKMWAKVKNVYKLTINDAEKAALVSMLATC